MSDKTMLDTFNNNVMRVIPTLVATAVITVTAGAYNIHVSVQRLIEKAANHDAKISELRTKIEQVEAASVKRTELLETFKRIEQQLEIALLRSGVKIPPKTLSN